MLWLILFLRCEALKFNWLLLPTANDVQSSFECSAILIADGKTLAKLPWWAILRER